MEIALCAKSTLDTPFWSRTSLVEAHFHLGVVFGLREDVYITRKYRPVPVLRPYIDPVTAFTSYSSDSNVNVI